MAPLAKYWGARAPRPPRIDAPAISLNDLEWFPLCLYQERSCVITAVQCMETGQITLCVPTTWWLDEEYLSFAVHSFNSPQYPSFQNLAWWSMRINTSVSMLRMTITGVLSRHTPTTKFAGNMTCVSASSCPHLYGILQCTWSYHRIIESSGGPEILTTAEFLV